ncbi:MAG: transcription elongation factor GreA [Chloroflexota bacterium]|nr:transcription elongation factor GreA [Chloroflexota bacterium]
MVMDKPIPLTVEGKRKLEEELYNLKEVRRPEVADRIQQAKLDGDVSESGEYEDAKNEQAFVEGRIRTLEHMLQHATIIERTAHPDVVGLGSQVKIKDGEGETYDWTIVGSAEASPRQARISNESPVGQALMGHKAGEKVRVNTPGGLEEFVIVSVR